MNLADWSRELPAVAGLVTSPPLMLSEYWYGDGRHRCGARMPLGRGAPLDPVKAAAARLGAKVQWNKNVGLLKLEADGWQGHAQLGGGPELALGEFVEILIQHRVDAARAQAGALGAARRLHGFAPFLELAGEHGAPLECAVRFEFEAATFGYLEIERPGFGAWLAADLEAWLPRRGFERVARGEDTLWSFAGSPPLLVSHWPTSPDKLRVDVDGLAEFEARRAAG